MNRQVLPCPMIDCDGVGEIDTVPEDEGLPSYGFSCKKCGGFIKGLKTWRGAFNRYKRKYRKVRENTNKEGGEL